MPCESAKRKEWIKSMESNVDKEWIIYFDSNKWIKWIKSPESVTSREWAIKYHRYMGKERNFRNIFLIHIVYFVN